MDKNALTEQRRETVIGLLKSMNIKKASEDGFDKDDVYDCMQQLCDLYEKNIEDLENAYENEIVTLKDRYQKYDDNNELYVSLIMEAKKSSNEIINQAKSEVENILKEGRDEVARQESALEQMRVNAEAEKTAVMEELNAKRKAVEAEKAAMRAEVEADKEKLSALKNKYNQQIISMEEEFGEIKTNILRTAGKLDSLKSKFQEEENISWDVADTAGGVQFPVDEVEVEEIYDDAPEAPAAEIEETVPEEGFEMPAMDFSMEPAEDIDLEAETQPAAEISFDDIDIEMPEVPAEEVKAEAADEEAPEEISFEGLEELFKEEEDK